MYTRRRQTGDYQNTSLNTDHHFQFNLGPENDRHALEVHLRPNFNYARNKSAFASLAAEFSDNPFTLDRWESLFYGPEADKALAAILVNKVQNRQRDNVTNVNGGAMADISFSIPHTPNYVTFNVGFNAAHNTNHSFDLYSLDYTPRTDRRHRYFDQPVDHLDARAGISLTTPFDANWKWVASTSLNYDYVRDKQDYALYRLDRLQEMADAELETLPSTHEAWLEALDATNSYFTDSEHHQTTLQFDGRYDNNVYRDNNKYARFRFTWKAGLTLLTEKLDFDGQSLRRDSRTAWLPSLGLEILRNTPGMKHEFELQTAYKQQLPAMLSLMGLRFDSDPLNIREGNTGLHRTDVFAATFFYRSDRWLSQRGKSLSANVRLYAYRNAVATAQTYDAATGVRSYRPENVNGNWNVTSSASFFSWLGRHGFSMRVSLQDNFYHSVDLTGTDTQLPLRSTVCTNYLALPVSLDYSRDKLSLGLKAQVAWNHVESKRPNFQGIDAADISVGVNGTATLPWNVQLTTDFTYFIRRGYAGEAMNTDDFVWNAQLSKCIMKGRLTFALVGYDILGQLSNIAYTVNAQGITETWRNVIPSYGMLRVIYRLNKQPKEK